MRLVCHSFRRPTCALSGAAATPLAVLVLVVLFSSTIPSSLLALILREERTMPRRKPRTLGVEPSRDVNAGARAAMALQLALEGHTYDEIARRVGYASKSGAFGAVQRELKRMLRHPAEELRQLEVARLDGLLTVYLPKAMSGDGWSMDRVLRIMERRDALLGLAIRPDQAQQQAQMVVIGVPQAVLEAV